MGAYVILRHEALLVLYMSGAVTGFNPGLGFTQIDAQAIYGIYVGMVYFMYPRRMVSRQYPWLSEGSYDRSCNYSFRTFHPSIATNTNIFLGFNFSSFRNRITEKQYFNYCWSIVQRWRCSKNIWLYDFYMSINIGSFLGFLICSYLGEKIGWHWGFGAAGIGMLFGVIQYYYFRGLLGNAGIKPNDMPDEQRQVYIKWSRVTIALMGAVIVAGLLGFISVDPRAFAEYFLYFLGVVAAIYFAYLLLLAGLSSQEKKNVFLLMILFVAAMFFWSGFDQSGGSLIFLLVTMLPFSGWLCDSCRLAAICKSFIRCDICSYLCRHMDKFNTGKFQILHTHKFAIGMFLMAISFLVMIAAVELALVSTVGMQWLIITYLLHTWGGLALSPVGLAAFQNTH